MKERIETLIRLENLIISKQDSIGKDRIRMHQMIAKPDRDQQAIQRLKSSIRLKTAAVRRMKSTYEELEKQVYRFRDILSGARSREVKRLAEARALVDVKDEKIKLQSISLNSNLAISILMFLTFAALLSLYFHVYTIVDLWERPGKLGDKLQYYNSTWMHASWSLILKTQGKTFFDKLENLLLFRSQRFFILFMAPVASLLTVFRLASEPLTDWWYIATWSLLLCIQLYLSVRFQVYLLPRLDHHMRKMDSLSTHPAAGSIPL